MGQALSHPSPRMPGNRSSPEPPDHFDPYVREIFERCRNAKPRDTGSDRPFPANSELPLADIRTAVQEFLLTSKRPTVVQWQDDVAGWQGLPSHHQNTYRMM